MSKTSDALSASVQAKNGNLYAVIPYRDGGKRKTAWRALGLKAGTSKSKVNKRFREVVNAFEAEYEERLRIAAIPGYSMTLYDFMTQWLERSKPNLQTSTYVGYRSMIGGRIRQFSESHPGLTVGTITVDQINEFYDTLFADGVVANTVIHYHAVLHKAFTQAFKDGIIDSNPFDRIDRPRKNKFHGEKYSEEELLTLLKVARTDVIYPAIMLAGGLGLRRSEALGVRWSRIDWEQNTVLLDTKIVEYLDDDGIRVIEPVEEMKNKSSRRTLPPPAPVLEMLREEKEQRELYMRIFKGSYNTAYTDYVCVDQLGNLLSPNYVTRRFKTLLRKNGLREIRFHDLRHTFASILISNDVPLINVSNFLGHSDLAITASFYIHLDKSSKLESARVIDRIWDEGSSEESDNSEE